MRSTRLPDKLHKLIWEAHDEFPGMFGGYNYDEWGSFDDYTEYLQKNLARAREAKKNGTLDELVKELEDEHAKVIEKINRERWG